MNIAIIPARGGSQRIPQKNIRPFCGQPIIAYSIRAARESGVFQRIIVSTDCEQIGAVAMELGAEVPFVRPAELSDHLTPTVPVIRHAIDWLSGQGTAVDFVGCVYATAPFVRAADLRTGFERLSETPDAEFAFPVTTFPFPIFRSLKIEDDRIRLNWPQHELTRSQDLPEAYHDAGQFYWGRSLAWLQHDRIFSARSIPLIVPRHRVQDIDTLEDWARAELMYAALHST